MEDKNMIESTGSELGIDLKKFFDEALKRIELGILNYSLDSRGKKNPDYVLMNQFTYDNLCRGAITCYPQMSMQIETYKMIRGLKIAILVKDPDPANQMILRVC